MHSRKYGLPKLINLFFAQIHKLLILILCNESVILLYFVRNVDMRSDIIPKDSSFGLQFSRLMINVEKRWSFIYFSVKKSRRKTSIQLILVICEGILAILINLLTNNLSLKPIILRLPYHMFNIRIVEHIVDSLQNCFIFLD